MFALGFLDDAVKLKKRNSGGISGKFRLAVEFILASVFVATLYYQGFSTNVFVPVPFWKVITLDMGLLFYPFVVLFMMSVTNAVNLTDGLDGLATTQVLLIILTCLLLHFVISPIVSSDFVLICVVCIGSLIGFLVHNSHPASIFMGEAGSLMLGGLVSVICVVLGVEFAFLLMGAFCFFETLSVVLQVSYFKLTKGKRIFRMSPLHHHFELGGIKESKIVVNAFIFTLICSTLTISTFLNGL
jgi:phospho-N-acetylmuramoyl-pentapeptide-transferase